MSSSDEVCWKRLAGSNNSSEVMTILGNVSSSSLVGTRERKWHVEPCIAKGITVPVSVSVISSWRKGSKGSSHKEMPNRRHWFGLTSEFGSFVPNHNPWWNSKTEVWPVMGSSHAVAAAQTSTFDTESHSSEKGETPHAWPVKCSGVKLAPKQHVSA